MIYGKLKWNMQQRRRGDICGPIIIDPSRVNIRDLIESRMRPGAIVDLDPPIQQMKAQIPSWRIFSL